MKKINVSEDMERKIIDYCYNRLDYLFNESGCIKEHLDEIEIEIFLARELWCKDMADYYEIRMKEIIGGE